MKNYYYLLYRVYIYYRKDYSESDGLSIYSTTVVSTLFLYFILLIPVLYIDYYFIKILNNLISGKLSVIIIMLAIGFLNYWFFIRNKKFLNFGFKTDKKGGYAIIGFIVLLALSFVFITNKNRDKIFKEREMARVEYKE